MDSSILNPFFMDFEFILKNIWKYKNKRIIFAVYYLSNTLIYSNTKHRKSSNKHQDYDTN